MIVIGLTGSIASGKSTVAAMFADAGVPVFSADEAVHRLYEGEAIGAIAAAFPAAIAEGKVDRGKLGEIVQADPAALRRLETLVHPLVRKEALTFVTQQRQAGMPIALLEIPLFFESGGGYPVDRVVVTAAPEAELRRRALERDEMTEARFNWRLARQMPQEEKKAKADFVIDTTQSLETVRKQVNEIIAACLAGGGP
jgi:dephospho-CoA kinase